METTIAFDTKNKNTDYLKKIGALEGFLSANEFQKRIRLEKCRAERTGFPLSLALFFLKKELIQETKYLLGFFNGLKKKTRETDIRGWLNTETIGLLLFNTGDQGAQRFVEMLIKDWKHRYCDSLTLIYPDPLFHDILSQPLKFPGFQDLKSRYKFQPQEI